MSFLREPFSDRLRTIRKAKKISQKELAAKIGISTRGYQRYESGESEPSFQTLDALASCLNVSVDYLLSRTNDSSPSIESIEFIDEDYGIIDLYGLDREDIRAVAHIVDALKRRQAK